MAFKKTKRNKKEETAGILDLEVTPNSQLFKDEFGLLCSSANSIIMVRSRELHRTTEFLYEYAVTQQAHNTLFYVWSIIDGWRQISTSPALSGNDIPANFSGNDPLNVNALLSGMNDPVIDDEDVPEFAYTLYPEHYTSDPQTMNPIKALMASVNYMRNSTGASPKGFFVMFAPEFWFEMPDFQEALRAVSDQATGHDMRLVLLCNSNAELPRTMQNNVKVIDFNVPNAPELYEECQNVLQSISIGTEDFVDMDEKQIADIVQNGLGMSVFEFTSALTRGIVRQTDDIDSSDDLDHEIILKTIIEQKSEVVRTSQSLELIKPIDISNVGGLDLLKDYLTKRKKAFSHEARAFGVDAPRGIMCCGIPGTGKSLIAKSAAHIFGIPCVGFDIGKVFGGLVGQSESQMRGALQQVEAMAPCVLFMDEVDKGFAGMSGGSGDNGTSARVFGTLLTWLQDRKAEAPPIYVIMTANNVDGLPPELLRKGRLDENFFLTFPNEEERRKILEIHLESRGHKLPAKELDDVVSLSNEFVGAELESVVKDAILEAFNMGESAPTGKLLSNFAEKLKPMSRTFPDRIKAMNSWATNNAVPASSSTDTKSPARPKVSATSSKVSISRRTRTITGKR